MMLLPCKGSEKITRIFSDPLLFSHPLTTEESGIKLHINIGDLKWFCTYLAYTHDA